MSSLSKWVTFYLIVVMGIGLTLLTSAPVRAQVAGATLTGTVTDTSSAVVPQAKVSIKNVSTGVTTVIDANGDGFYAAPNLIPGSYEVTVSATGFASAVQTGLVLTVGARQLLNFSLKVGEVSQVVEVTTAAPSVDLTSSSITAEVTGTEVRELPLDGRSWTDLATLQPGVNNIVTQPAVAGASDRANRGFGQQTTISGGRPGWSNFRLDGISMNDYENSGPGSVLGGTLGVDAILEFSVITTNYSAEYGKTAGGVVNAITRPGTNQFHGDAYEFLRNSALDARNFFDPATIPDFRRNQFGGSAGGPIQKDRTFIFGDYEGIRQLLGVSVLNDVPSLAARSGNMCSVPSSSACSPNTVTVNPSPAQYVQFWPLPNGGLVPGSNGDQAYFRAVTNQIVGENFFTIRADHKFSDKDSIFTSYDFDKTPFSQPDSFDEVTNGSLTFRQQYTAEETHTFSSSMVNAVRVGYLRVTALGNYPISTSNPMADTPTLGAVPGRNATVVTVGGGITEFFGGLNTNTNNFYHWNSIQGYDDAFFTRGTHTIKFGFSVENMQANGGNNGLGGRFGFSSWTSFLENIPNSYASVLPGKDFPIQLRQTLFAPYIQDDWRWRHNLTLNLGLRYEPLTVPTELNGLLGELHTITDTALHIGNPLYNNNTLRNFEPRVGFAWDPFGTGKTSVRGGFGVFDVLPLPYYWLVPEIGSVPSNFKASLSPVPAGVFYSGAAPLLVPATATTFAVDASPHASYTMQWNFNIQRELASNLTLMVSYLGSRGVHLPVRNDSSDLAIPQLVDGRYVYPSPVGSGTKINPNFGSIATQFFMGNSFYDALQVLVNKKLSHGLQMQTSFTWQRSIDDNSTGVSNGTSLLNAQPTQPAWFDLSTMRGPSDFNIPRTLVINATWQVPLAKSLTGPAGWLAHGWTLGGIFTVEDGAPFSPTWGFGGDPMGDKSGSAGSNPDRLYGSGCTTLVNPGNPNNYIKTQCFSVPIAPSAAFYTAHCDPTKGVAASMQCYNLLGDAGRNILSGPGLVNLDFAVYKDSHVRRISESADVQFRVETFNILNRPNFGPPETANGEADIFNTTGGLDPAGGVLLRTDTQARIIQFALKLIW